MTRRIVRILALALALFGPSAAAAGAQPLYGITWNNQLITIDTTTGAGTLVGLLSSNMNPPGLGFRGSKLYTWDQNANLIRQLDPATGATLNTINIGLAASGAGDVVFRSDGLGFLAPINPSSQLISFDVTVPSSTVIGPLNPSMYGLAFNPSGVLYGLSQGAGSLYTINQGTAATTLVGNTGLPWQFFGGIACNAQGKMYAALGPIAGSASLYQIDPSTAAVTLIGSIGFNEVTGIAFPPAPPAPPPPSSGAGEGSFAGVAGPPHSGFEGSFGSGGQLVAPAAATSPSGGVPGRPVLAGPFLQAAGAGQGLTEAPAGMATSPPAGANLWVRNVSYRQPAPAAGGDGVLGWLLVGGLALATVLTLVKKRSSNGGPGA